MIDPSKVRVGDTLVAHLKVTEACDAPGDGVGVEFPPSDGAHPYSLPARADFMRYVSLTRFVEHIPAPRKIEVGSRVHPIGVGYHLSNGVVLAEDGALVWVKWPNDSPGTWEKKALEVID